MQRPKIFIAEDNRETANIIRESLKKFDIVSRIFRSGADFLMEVDNGLELVILDVNLSTLDGFQTLIELRRRNPELLIVVISGDNIDHNRMEALDHGADYFLPKPIDLNVLESIILENFDIINAKLEKNKGYYA